MKIRIVNFQKEHVDTSMDERFPYDTICNGAILSAHFPSVEEIMKHGANEENAKYALCKMAVEKALIIDGIPGFENDPIVIRAEAYEIVDHEGQSIPSPDPATLLEMMFSSLSDTNK